VTRMGVVEAEGAEKAASNLARLALPVYLSPATCGEPSWQARGAAVLPPTKGSEDAWPLCQQRMQTSALVQSRLRCPDKKHRKHSPDISTPTRPSQTRLPRSSPRCGETTASPSTAWAAPSPGGPSPSAAPPAAQAPAPPDAARRFPRTRRRRGLAPRHGRCAWTTPARLAPGYLPAPNDARSQADGRRRSPWCGDGRGWWGRRAAPAWRRGGDGWENLPTCALAPWC
jgi:hypothetical protein